MLDSRTGELTFPLSGLRLGPGITQEAFLSLPVARSVRPHAMGKPWTKCELTVPPGELGAFPAILLIYFHASQLKQFTLFDTSARFDVDPSDLTPEAERARTAAELARKAAHDDWLAAQGVEPGSYPWVHLWSEYSDKSGFSSIGIRYGDRIP